jgi:hypothetical protein
MRQARSRPGMTPSLGLCKEIGAMFTVTNSMYYSLWKFFLVNRITLGGRWGWMANKKKGVGRETWKRNKSVHKYFRNL